MLQPSTKFASVFLTVKLLLLPSFVMAATPTPPAPPTVAAPPTAAAPPTQASERIRQFMRRLPAAMRPYLDPSIHQDSLFKPTPSPTAPAETQPTEPKAQALRLEIRLSRRQVTLYRGTTLVKNYAIAVGRPGWETPVGAYEVKQMIKNPTWIHPLQKGVVIPGGDPENPLGRYWIGFWTDGKNWIGFHGTPTPRSVGRAASHGCIRMYNKDVEELFKQVTIGTVVTVVK